MDSKAFIAGRIVNTYAVYCVRRQKKQGVGHQRRLFSFHNVIGVTVDEIVDFLNIMEVELKISVRFHGVQIIRDNICFIGDQRRHYHQPLFCAVILRIITYFLELSTTGNSG